MRECVAVVEGQAEGLAWMQDLDRLNVRWSTRPGDSAENWRGAPGLGPRISEV